MDSGSSSAVIPVFFTFNSIVDTSSGKSKLGAKYPKRTAKYAISGGQTFPSGIVGHKLTGRNACPPGLAILVLNTPFSFFDYGRKEN
jgi:hypothetical protein